MRERELRRTRRRGLALAAVGLSTMVLALLSMRFEEPPHSRAARIPDDDAWDDPVDAGIASQPTEPASHAAQPAPVAAPAPTHAPGVKKPRRSESPPPAPPPPVQDSLHRAGPLRRHEF